MLKKQLEAGKLVAHGGQVVQQQNQSGMVMVDNGMLRQQQQQQGVQSQQFGQQESSSEMYANFQQAQAMQGFEGQDQGGGAGGQQVSFMCLNGTILMTCLMWDWVELVGFEVF